MAAERRSADRRAAPQAFSRGEWFGVVGLTSAALGWIWILAHQAHPVVTTTLELECASQCPCNCGAEDPTGLL